MNSIDELPSRPRPPRLLWLDLTRRCQLACIHCYNESGPQGGHGTMSREGWLRVLDQAADYGVRNVQFIGGEPTMHPHFAELVDHALNIGLHVEVYSNLVHVSRRCWELFQRQGLTLATSYYSDRATEHDTVTRRPSHRRTRANISQAVGLGISVRVGIVTTEGDRETDAARRDLAGLGVTRISVDRVRPFGRGGEGEGQEEELSHLCGGCGDGTAAVGPDGTVSPCVFSGHLGVGNVEKTDLADILRGSAMAEISAKIRAVTVGGDPCDPTETECTPGFPGSECTPRT